MNPEEHKFEIQSVVEQRPFEQPAVRAFFTKWCGINDSIVPQIIDRKEWGERGMRGVLEKREDGKQNLYIPADLALWEMVGVMEVVDRDTFAAKPERQDEKKNEVLALGKTFQHAGVYIAQRLDAIAEGKEIARALAEEFYDYGRQLAGDKSDEKSPTLDTAPPPTASGVEEVDRFLAGDDLYRSRHARAEQATIADPTQKEEFYEAQRRQTLAQFFGASEKAFKLKERIQYRPADSSEKALRPWQNDAPIHSAFLAKIERSMTQKIETPKRELENAMFRRGMEKLLKEMKEGGWKHGVNSFFEEQGIDFRLEQKKLIDTLGIAQLKDELDTLRQTGDIMRISDKERKIADKIQAAVSKLPYQSGANYPSKIVANQHINCVGASTLGGALLKEAGLHYLVGDVPEHSILFLVTSDGKVEWRDMQNASYNKQLTDEMIDKSKAAKTVTVSDIVAFSRNPKAEGLMFDISGESYRNKLPWVKEGERQYVTVFEPEYGEQIQVLSNAGHALSDLGQHAEALEAYRQAVAANPAYAYAYNGLGAVLQNLNRTEEAVEAYRHAVAVNPKYAYAYHNLGLVLSELHRTEEAVGAYQKFVDLADKQKDQFLIKRTKMIIGGLKNTLAEADARSLHVEKG